MPSARWGLLLIESFQHVCRRDLRRLVTTNLPSRHLPPPGAMMEEAPISADLVLSVDTFAKQLHPAAAALRLKKYLDLLCADGT